MIWLDEQQSKTLKREKKSGNGMGVRNAQGHTTQTEPTLPSPPLFCLLLFLCLVGKLRALCALGGSEGRVFLLPSADKQPLGPESL